MTRDCPQCRRSFGGEQAYRRAHPRSGCRSARELRRIGLRRDDAGVWHRPARTDPGQLRLPLFGRGRPRKTLPPDYSYEPLGGGKYRVRVVGPPRHEEWQRWLVEAA